MQAEKPVAAIKKDTTKTQEKDTLYKMGKYMVIGQPGSAVEIIDLKKKQKPSGQLADSLYYDENVLILGDFAADQYAYVRFNNKYRFDSFPVEVYTGKLADPDFTGNPYASDTNYRVAMLDGCKNRGIDFAGKYTVVYTGCGCMCSGIHLVDRITGKIVYPKNAEEGKWGFLHQANSRLMVANAETLVNEDLRYYIPFGGSSFFIPEIYVWENTKFRRLRNDQ